MRLIIKDNIIIAQHSEEIEEKILEEKYPECGIIEVDDKEIILKELKINDPITDNITIKKYIKNFYPNNLNLLKKIKIEEIKKEYEETINNIINPFEYFFYLNYINTYEEYLKNKDINEFKLEILNIFSENEQEEIYLKYKEILKNIFKITKKLYDTINLINSTENKEEIINIKF